MFENILQPTHLILILAIALLMFGPQKLPQIGKGLGEAIRGFREGMQSQAKQIESAQAEKPSEPAAPAKPVQE